MGGRLVLFVHGLGGSPEGTWGQFEKLLRADHQLKGVSYASYTYPTSIWRSPWAPRYSGVSTLAQGLATFIDEHHPTYQDITLVCHSLGGLVGRQYLIDTISANKVLRVKRILLYAVPNLGSDMAKVGKLVSWRHSQLRDLRRDSDALSQIADGWKRVQPHCRLDVRYIVAEQDGVVDKRSASQEWENADVKMAMGEDHRSVVKPKSRDKTSYLVLKNLLCPPHIEEVAGTAAPERQPGQALCAPQSQARETRVSISALLRVEKDGKYLLVKNLHRQESFAPFGGVYKYYEGAKAQLDQLSFRPQVAAPDMSRDLRGFIPSAHLDAFRAWVDSGAGRENFQDCLRRELREELSEIGLSEHLVPIDLGFELVRTVNEGPEYIKSAGYDQYRCFYVCDVRADTDKAREFLRELERQSEHVGGLLWVSTKEAIRGRAKPGIVVGHHVPYLFGTERYRDGEPIFLTD